MHNFLTVTAEEMYACAALAMLILLCFEIILHNDLKGKGK